MFTQVIPGRRYEPAEVVGDGFRADERPGEGNIPAQLTISLNNGTTIVWDGTGDNGTVVASGQYFIEVSEQDGQGAETILTAHVMVMSDTANAGMGTITARPNLMNPTTGITSSSPRIRPRA